MLSLKYMEPDLSQKLALLETKLDESVKLVRQMRQYFLWTLVITVLVVLLPLVGLFIAIPQFLDFYSGLGL